MTGSAAARRRISRRIGAVTRRTWPVIQTRNFCVVVAAIALVDVDAAGRNPGQRLQLGDYRPQRVAVDSNGRQMWSIPPPRSAVA
jgi:hypothetical protein